MESASLLASHFEQSDTRISANCHMVSVRADQVRVAHCKEIFLRDRVLARRLLDLQQIQSLTRKSLSDLLTIMASFIF
jgi:hypothetical protein